MLYSISNGIASSLLASFLAMTMSFSKSGIGESRRLSHQLSPIPTAQGKACHCEGGTTKQSLRH